MSALDIQWIYILDIFSFGYTLYRTVDRNFANVILNIVKQKGII